MQVKQQLRADGSMFRQTVWAHITGFVSFYHCAANSAAADVCVKCNSNYVRASESVSHQFQSVCL